MLGPRSEIGCWAKSYKAEHGTQALMIFYVTEILPVWDRWESLALFHSCSDFKNLSKCGKISLFEIVGSIIYFKSKNLCEQVLDIHLVYLFIRILGEWYRRLTNLKSQSDRLSELEEISVALSLYCSTAKLQKGERASSKSHFSRWQKWD